MSYLTQYKILFEFNILHRYFLDDGAKKYEVLEESDQKKQLQGYSVHSVLHISPTLDTVTQLNGHRLLFKHTNTGFIIASRTSNVDINAPFIEMSRELSFTFLMRVKDPLFYNYTELKADATGNLFYLSNTKPASEGVGFPLLKNDGGFFSIKEQAILSEVGTEIEMSKLTSWERSNLIGLVKIHLYGSDTASNIIDDMGKFIYPPPVFTTVFENRQTFWRYLFSADQTVGDQEALIKEDGDAKRWITKMKHPLTRSGFVSLKLGDTELPNPSITAVKPDKTTQNIFSEIYM